MKWWGDLWQMISTEVYPASSTMSTRADFSFYDVLFKDHLYLFLWTYFTIVYAYRMIMTVLSYSYSWTHAYFSSCLKPVCMSHTKVLCISWVGGAVCINVYEIQGSHSGGNCVVVYWVVIESERWLLKLQGNTLPSTLIIDTVCCSSAFVPTFQTT